jgi:hypothetical protein
LEGLKIHGFVLALCLNFRSFRFLERDVLFVVHFTSLSWLCFQKADQVPDAAKQAHQDLFKAPPEWKGWEERQIEEKIFASQGIKIRRRPFTGPPQHYVGPFEFRLQNEGNTPRNILEEIIWNKDLEVTQVLLSDILEDMI